MKERNKEIPEYKLKTVDELVKIMKDSKTILIASTKKLPSSQFHDIKKKLRGVAEIRVAKKSLVIRAIELSKIKGLEKIKEVVTSDVALFFSKLDAFELSGVLTDNQSSSKAKAGDIAPEDIVVQPGPTDLSPGPAISELSGVGLKVSVEGGKLAIKLQATIVRAGEVIKENVASVMGKLGITPIKLGFEPVAAYDKLSEKVYIGIKIDKKEVLNSLISAIKEAFGFSVNVNYVTTENISFIIERAGREYLALEKFAQTTTREEA